MGLKENLRYYRKRTGMSQEQMAQRLDVVRTTVTQWESGYSRPRVDMLKDIADLLDITVPRLLSEAPPGLPADGILSGDEEYRLITYYRQLNEDGRRQLLNVAQGFASSGAFQRPTGDAPSLQSA